MTFALDRDDGRLLAFASPIDAAAHCKAIDVEDGFWLFFADDGSPLEALFENPNRPEDSPEGPGAYALQRAMSGRWLQERLGEVRTVAGGGLTDVADLEETLKINRGKRVARDLGRG